jgi:hypothetical protein
LTNFAKEVPTYSILRSRTLVFICGDVEQVKNEEYHILAKKLHRLDNSLAQVVKSGIGAQDYTAEEDMPKTLVSAHAALKRAQSLLVAHHILQSYKWQPIPHVKLSSQTQAVTSPPAISTRMPSTPSTQSTAPAPPAFVSSKDFPTKNMHKGTAETTNLSPVGMPTLTTVRLSPPPQLAHDDTSSSASPASTVLCCAVMSEMPSA